MNNAKKTGVVVIVDSRMFRTKTFTFAPALFFLIGEKPVVNWRTKKKSCAGFIPLMYPNEGKCQPLFSFSGCLATAMK